MWQDVSVTMIAIGALAVLARRWFVKRTKPAAGACASCALAPGAKVDAGDHFSSPAAKK